MESLGFLRLGPDLTNRRLSLSQAKTKGAECNQFPSRRYCKKPTQKARNSWRSGADAGRRVYVLPCWGFGRIAGMGSQPPSRDMPKSTLNPAPLTPSNLNPT